MAARAADILDDNGAVDLDEQTGLPGYQYGYPLNRDPRYSEARWDAIEPQVKRDWDQRGFGP